MSEDIFDLIGDENVSSKKAPPLVTPKKSVPLEQDIFDIAQTKKPEISIPEVEQQKAKSSEALRHAARTGTRILETPIEVAKGLADLPKRGLEYAFEKVLGRPLSEEEKGKFDTFQSEFGGLAQKLPETEKIREFEKKHTGEYLQPQSKGEELSDEIIQDFTSFLLPIPGSTEAKLATKALKSAELTGLGQTAKQTTKAFGGTEEQQDLSKTLSTFLRSLWKPEGAKKYGSSLYKKAEESLPKDASGDAKVLEHNMKSLKEKMMKGTSAESEKAIQNEATNVLEKIHDGKMNYDEAVASKRSINEKSQKFLFETPDRTARARARKFYNQINSDLNKFIETSKDKYPEFYKNQRAADEVFGTMASSQKISNIIKNHSKEIGLAGVAPVVHFLFSGNWPAAASTLGVYGIGTGVLKTGELIARMTKSPTLRKYYLNVIKSASEENAANTIKNMKKFQEKSEEDPEIYKILHS